MFVVVFILSFNSYGALVEGTWKRRLYTESEKDEMSPCRKFWGKSLKECMEKKLKNNEIFIRNLLFLHEDQRENYFEQTLKTSQDYKKLESIFNETYWESLWQVMSEQEKNKFFTFPVSAVFYDQASSKQKLKELIAFRELSEN